MLSASAGAALLCDLGLSQRGWGTLRSYLPDAIPPLSRVKGWLHANEAAVVAEEVNHQRMAGVSLIDSVRCDLTVSSRLRRSQHKAIKIGSDSASDEQEKDVKKKSITILVYCYVGEKVGHHEHIVEVRFFFFFFFLGGGGGGNRLLIYF